MHAGSDVLVADDDRLVIFVVKDWLEDLDCKVHLAENAIQALQILKSHPAIKVLVTDIRMPIMNGYKLIREAQKMRPDLKIVIMTGYADEDELMGTYPIVQKPFYPIQLEEALSAAMGCTEGSS